MLYIVAMRMTQTAVTAVRASENTSRADVAGQNSLMPFGLEGFFTVGAAIGHRHDQACGNHKEDRAEDDQRRRDHVPRYLILCRAPVYGTGCQGGCQNKKQRKVENKLLFHLKAPS